jgi:stage III sporulation protein AH
MMVLKKKTIIVITLALLVVAAGYVSTKYGRVMKVDKNDELQTGVADDMSDSAVNNSKVAAGYFIDIKLERESQRASSKQTLKDMIDDESASKEAKAKAENQLLEIVKNSEVEMISEALIKSQGFEDAIVFINDDQANVTIKAKDVTADQISKVKNIVCQKSKLPATKVIVQPRE